MKSKDEVSPMDSWIVLTNGLKMNAELQQEWIQKSRSLRKTRGDILAMSFEIENRLDFIIGEVFFPGTGQEPESSAGPGEISAYVNGSVLHSIFRRVFLKSAGITFGRKVRLFIDISKEVQALGDLVEEPLKKDIGQIVKIRNVFAHQPITFEIVGEKPTFTLAAYILVEGNIVELTQNICDEYKRLASSLIANLRTVQDKLRANTDRRDASPLSKVGVIWMGHEGLNDDEWEVKNSEKPLNLRDIHLQASRSNLKIDVEIQESYESDPESSE